MGFINQFGTEGAPPGFNHQKPDSLNPQGSSFKLKAVLLLEMTPMNPQSEMNLLIPNHDIFT